MQRQSLNTMDNRITRNGDPVQRHHSIAVSPVIGNDDQNHSNHSNHSNRVGNSNTYDSQTQSHSQLQHLYEMANIDKYGNGNGNGNTKMRVDRYQDQNQNQDQYQYQYHSSDEYLNRWEASPPLNAAGDKWDACGREREGTAMCTCVVQ